MDAMEEVAWMGGFHVNPMRICAIRHMLGVGCDVPPHVVEVIETS
jgi:hypothetical protein